jgi:hypothetical protein
MRNRMMRYFLNRSTTLNQSKGPFLSSTLDKPIRASDNMFAIANNIGKKIDSLICKKKVEK